MSRWLFLALFTLVPARGEDYCFGFLNAHPQRQEIPEAQAGEIQKGHLAHMNRMAVAGHLLAAGPILTSGGPRGIVLYRCQSAEEASQWTSLDPAVRNKRLVVEIYRWRGPDGIGEPLVTRLKADPNVKVEMTRLPLIVLRTTERWKGLPPPPILAEHLRHNAEIRKQGKLRAAGPFVDSEGRAGLVPGYVGVFVLAAMPLEEAIAVVENDPFVREGFARIDGYVWMVAEDAIPKP